MHAPIIMVRSRKEASKYTVVGMKNTVNIVSKMYQITTKYKKEIIIIVPILWSKLCIKSIKYQEKSGTYKILMHLCAIFEYANVL